MIHRRTVPYKVDDDLRSWLLEQQESGMGYQVVRGRGDRCLVLNAEIALPLDEPDVLRTDLMWLQDHMDIAAAEEGDHWLARIEELDTLRIVDCRVEGHGSYQSHTAQGEVFVRYSAFFNDRRIGSYGSVQAGTYCTTETDTAVVPSGLAAVGRYALPNGSPAIHRFELRPPAGSPIHCGTVTRTIARRAAASKSDSIN